MSDLSIAGLGQKFSLAGRLELNPLCVFGSEEPPSGAVVASSLNRCIARAMLMMASKDEASAIYISSDDKGCCPGGLAWLGLIEMPQTTKYFVSTGRKDFRGGAAEHLKATPDLFERSVEARGKVTPPGKYIVVQDCSSVSGNPGVKSILCFGSAEQVRNLAGLAHFSTADPFSPVIMPWGPSCATFVTYPAGMAAKAPKMAAFTGPVDPTGNAWLSPDLMAMGIPIEKAREMARNLEESFIIKRPKVAYPERRL